MISLGLVYSNEMRGVRQRGGPPELVPHGPGVSPLPLRKRPSKKWRDVTLRVWHYEPHYPVCQSPMRVLALIEAPRDRGNIALELERKPVTVPA